MEYGGMVGSPTVPFEVTASWSSTTREPRTEENRELLKGLNMKSHAKNGIGTTFEAIYDCWMIRI